MPLHPPLPYQHTLKGPRGPSLPNGSTGSSQGLPTLGGTFTRAAELALDLADVARAAEDARLVRLALEAHGVVEDLHQVGELLATVAGVPEPQP